MQKPTREDDQRTHPLFHQIYTAALAGDTDTLQRLLDEHGTLDVWCRLDTPTSRLAAESAFTALECLKQFPHNINWVANGLAIGGYIQEAQALIDRGAHINWVAYGLAQGGYSKEARRVKTRDGFHNTRDDLHNVRLRYCLYSAGRGGQPKSPV